MSKLRMAGFAGLLVVSALVGGTVIGSVAATSFGITADRAAGPTGGPGGDGSADRRQGR